MGRFWSLLFLLVPILGVGCFVWAMADLWPMHGHWLPEDVNDHGHVIDSLFMFILYLTGAIFVVTGIVFVLVPLEIRRRSECRSRQVHARQSHAGGGLVDHPAATLVFIAIYQMNAWADAKLRRPMLPVPTAKWARGRRSQAADCRSHRPAV